MTDYIAASNRNGSPTFYGMIADLEASAGRARCALASLERGLQLAEETGERWSNSVLLRRKGEILSKRDPGDPAAEEALKSAASVAREQGARSYELIASLALARHWRDAGRAAEANAALASALRGFSPSLELPQVAEARALLGGVAPDGYQSIRARGKRT